MKERIDVANSFGRSGLSALRFFSRPLSQTNESGKRKERGRAQSQ